MREMKNIVSCLFMAIVVVLDVLPQSSGSFCSVRDMRIPFAMDSYGNVLLTIDGQDGERYTFRFDAAMSEYNVSYELLYTHGAAGLTYSDVYGEMFGRATALIRRDYPYITDDAAIRDMAGEILRNCRLTNTIGGFSVQGVPTEPASFLYASGVQEGKIRLHAIDGSIGPYFFQGCRNIVIDYVANELVINADLISGASTPMEQLFESGGYEVEIRINGVPQMAEFSTTMDRVYIRDEYRKTVRYSDEDVVRYAMEDSSTARRIGRASRKIVLELGDIQIPCRGYTESKDDINEPLRKMMRKRNFLGHAAFKGRAVQLDFENGVFRIR